MKLKLMQGYNIYEPKVELGTLEYIDSKYIWTPSDSKDKPEYGFLPKSFFEVPGLPLDDRKESTRLFWFFKDRITSNKSSPHFKARLVRFGMEEYNEWEYVVAGGLKLATDSYELVKES